MTKKENNFSIIDKGLTVEGTFTTKGRLIIKGTVKGNLDGDTIIVAEEGAVHADTTVNSITIGGVFEGEIKAKQDIIILSTGKCKGKLECRNLVIEAGGMLNGQVNCITAEKPPAPEKSKPAADKKIALMN